LDFSEHYTMLEVNSNILWSLVNLTYLQKSQGMEYYAFQKKSMCIILCYIFTRLISNVIFIIFIYSIKNIMSGLIIPGLLEIS